MVTWFGEALRSGTSPKPGEDGSYEDQSRLTRLGGGGGGDCQTLPFCGLEYSDGVEHMKPLLQSHLHIPRV